MKILTYNFNYSKNEKSNMKLMALFTFVFLFLLIIPSVKAITWNTTPHSLDINLNPYIVGQTGFPMQSMKAQYINDSWFFGYGYRTVGDFDYVICKYDKDFNRIDGCDVVANAIASQGSGDFQIINTTHLRVDYSMSFAPNCYFRTKNVSLSDLALGTEVSLYQIHAGSCQPVDEIWVRVVTDWNWVFPPLNWMSITGNNSYDYYKDGLNGALFIPSGETIVNNPFLVYNPEWNTYNLFYDDNQDLKVLYYDDSLNYLGVQRLVNLVTPLNETNVLRVSNGIYLTSIYNESSFYMALFHSDTNTHYTFVEEQTVTVPNANSTYRVDTPYLAYDNDRARRYLFYNLRNLTTVIYPNGFYYLEEIIPCTCGSWYNTTDCIGDKRIRNRDCIPNECDNEISYIFDTYCNQTKTLEERHELQRTERFCEVQNCYSNWVNPTEIGSVSCEAQLTIDGDCSSNIVSNATIQTEVEWITWSFGSLGDVHYNLLLCNPLHYCYESPFLCETQFNMTQTLTYNDYYPNDTAVAHFQIDAGACKQTRSWMRDYGWENYRVKGNIRYCCDRKCGGYKCTRSGLVEYRIQQYLDCQYNDTSKEVCTYGCRNGECLSHIGAEQIIRSPSGNPFSWILGEAEYNFPSPILMVFSIGISTGGGIYASMLTKKWQFGAVATLGLVGLFLNLGWLPSIIGILWILSIALLLAKMITELRGA